jgi:creatinine amidohydrolase/Fe(II)-dependent formamide hydrolase-like protein
MPAALAAVILAWTGPSAAAPRTRVAASASVEFEMMTWPEVKAALQAGKTTALIYTGGTEQRGPQNVNGGHTLMGREVVKAIAERLGDAVALPVLPYSPNNASPDLPGAIGLTNDILGDVLQRLAEQAIATGFKNVVLMGDHGGGQGPGGPYDTVAKLLDAKYGPAGVHVYYCDQVYAAAEAFNRQLQAEGYPANVHAGVTETSEMLYLERGRNWVRRDLIASAVGGVPSDFGPDRAKGAPPSGNGVKGDARRSTAALGKRQFELKVDYAVRQIRQFIPPP